MTFTKRIAALSLTLVAFVANGQDWKSSDVDEIFKTARETAFGGDVPGSRPMLS